MKRLLVAITVVLVLGLTLSAVAQKAGPPTPPPATLATDFDALADRNHASLPLNAAPTTTLAALAAPKAVPLTDTYRVGPGDVLDIRLLNFSSGQSSLFTILPDGRLEYPYVSDLVNVQGLTTEEIAARLNALIKVFDKPQTVVNVRSYGSHVIMVTGLTANPGPQSLQREAIPLYALLTLIQPKPEADSVVLVRPGQPEQVFKLAQPETLEVLVQPGDEVRVQAAPPAPPKASEFYYIIGTVNMPGQKDFHPGLTLTQALFAAGGLTKNKDAKARLLRQGADGRLNVTEYNLKRISQGKDPDPALQVGDRLEVVGKE